MDGHMHTAPDIEIWTFETWISWWLVAENNVQQVFHAKIHYIMIHMVVASIYILYISSLYLYQSICIYIYSSTFNHLPKHSSTGLESRCACSQASRPTSFQIRIFSGVSSCGDAPICAIFAIFRSVLEQRRGISSTSIGFNSAVDDSIWK